MSDQAQPSSLCVIQRSESPCTSNHCIFHIDGLPQLVFCAFAVDGGTIVVQQAPSQLQPFEPSLQQSSGHAAPKTLLGSGSRLHHPGTEATPAAPLQDSFTTVLLINAVDAHWDEPIRHIVWGGGPHCLLAAASKQDISIFSLAPFASSLAAACAEDAAAAYQQHLQQQQQQQQQLQVHQQHLAHPHPHPHHHVPGMAVPATPAAAAAGVSCPASSSAAAAATASSTSSSPQQHQPINHPSVAAVAVQSYKAPSALLSLQWTYDAAGLLLADTNGNIIMLQVKRWSELLPIADTSKPPRQQQQQQHSSSSSWTVRELWRIHAEAAHGLIAAGNSPLRPSATVPVDSAQRVIIWWPSPDEKSPGAYKVGAEVIRHPVKAVHIQWSPPLAQQSSSSNSSGGGGSGDSGFAGGLHPGSPGRTLAGAAAAGVLKKPKAAAAGASAGSAGNAAAATALTSSGVDSSSSSSESQGQAALMTVGVDGIIRIFVEVVMSDITPPLPPAPTRTSGTTGTPNKQAAAAAAAAPGSPAVGAASSPTKAAAAAAPKPAAVMSQFCLTLVIEPPGLGPQVSGFMPGLIASWARPLQPQPYQDSSSMLWLLGSFTGPNVSAATGSGQVPLAAALAGTEAAAAAAAVANVSSSSSNGYQDQVFLWGIDGLAGVVLSGIAQNAIMSNKATQPRVWCWGKDSGQLHWQQPPLLLQHAEAAAAAGQVSFRHGLDAWVVESGAGPLLSAGQHYHIPQVAASSSSNSSNEGTVTAAAAGVLSESRCYQVIPLTGYNEAGLPASAISVSQKHSRLHARPAEDWVQVSLHTAADVAATVSSRGSIAIWGLAPIKQLPMPLQQQQQQPQQQQQQGLPVSWRQCSCCCWLTFGGAAAAAAAAAAGAIGLPLLLAVHGRGGVDICMVELSNTAGAAAAAGAGMQAALQQQQACASEVYVSGVYVLAHLAIPIGIPFLRELVEVSATIAAAAAVDGAADAADSEQQQQQQQQQQQLVLQTSLLGLGSLQEGQQQQQQQAQQQQQQQLQQVQLLLDATLPDGSSDGEDAWVAWALQLQLPLAAAAAAGDAAAAAAVGQQWQLLASLPELTRTSEVVTTAAAAGTCIGWPCDSNKRLSSSSSGGGGGASADGSSSSQEAAQQSQLLASISCVQCPTPASPFFVTGNAAGLLMCWQVLGSSGVLQPPLLNPNLEKHTENNITYGISTGKSDSTPTHASTEPPHQQQQGLGGANAEKTLAIQVQLDCGSGPSLELVQASVCDVGGVEFGGIAVAVALCTSAGYAAVAITCGQTELEDAVFIWCLEGTTHTHPASRRQQQQQRQQHQQYTSGCAAAAAAAAAPVFVLDCLLPLEDTASSIAWLDTAGLQPLLAVGYASGLAELYSRDHIGQWNTLACYQAGLSVDYIAANRLGLPLLLTGSQLLLLSNLATAAAPPGVAAAGHATCSMNSINDLVQTSAVNSWSTQSSFGQQQLTSMLRIPGGPARGALLSAPCQQVVTHAGLAAAAGSSSLPLYHPDVLGVLVGQGKTAAAVRVVRYLLALLRHIRGELLDGDDVILGCEVSATIAAKESSTLSCRQSLLLPAAAGAAAAGPHDDSSSSVQVPTAGDAAAAAQQGSSGTCIVPLNTLMVDTECCTAASDVVQRCCAFRDAAVAAALGLPPPSNAMTQQQQQQQQQYTGAAAAVGRGGGGSSSNDVVTPGTPEPQTHTRSVAAVAAAAGGGALETGVLDMSAFGSFGFDSSANTGNDQNQQQQKQHQPSTAPAAAAMDTGLLDMSAFVGFQYGEDTGAADDGWDSPATRQQPPHPPVAAAAAAPATTLLETGMLDMSAFGEFGFGGIPADDEDWDTSNQQQQQDPQQQQQQQASNSSALQTGMLDMSAFGGAGFGTSAAESDWSTFAQQQVQQQQQQQQGGTAGSGSSSSMGGEAACQPCAALQLKQAIDPHLLAKTTAVFPKPPPLPVTKRLAGAAAVNTAAATAAAKQQLLSRGEVKELHRLLDIAATKSTSGSSSAKNAAASRLYYSKLLAAAGAADADKDGYRGDSNDAVAAAATAESQQQQGLAGAGDARVLATLGLDPALALKLCHIAAALSTRTFMGQDGLEADEDEERGYNNVVSDRSNTSGGPASAAALAAAWASGGEGLASAGGFNLSRRLSGAPTGGALAGSSSSSSTKSVPLTELAGNDSAYGGALWQGLDPAGKLFAVNARIALLQLAAAAAAARNGAAAGSAAAAAGEKQQRDKRFAAAVARLFQPVSVSRNTAAGSSRGAALLAHYPVAPLPTAAGSSSGSFRGTPPLSPGRLQQLQAGPSSRSGLSSSSGFGGRSGSSRGLAAITVRSSMSVASMLSFSSLKDLTEGGSTDGAAAAANKIATSSSWAAFVGLIPGITPLHCLWAAASNSQQALLDVLLPLAPDDVDQQQAAAAAAVYGDGAAGASGSKAGATATAGGSSFAASGGPDQQHLLTWPKLRALGVGFWLTDHTALRATAEALARAQYAAAKDPHEPALMYASLGRKNVLMGLFRSSGNKKVADFLARDFGTAEGRAAASKNAFHLLGQHRYHLAAAFFVLAGSGWDAVSVLAREAADPQLALLVARLLDSNPAAAAAAAAAAGGGGVSSLSMSSSSSASVGGRTPAAAAAAVHSTTGGPLQRRLVDEELLLLAEADSDPAAAALSAWVRGSDGSSAVTILLSRLAAVSMDCASGQQDVAAAAVVQQQQQQQPGLTAIASVTDADTAAAAATTATSGSAGCPPQQQQQQGQVTIGSIPQHHSRPAHHQPSPVLSSQLPLILHWVLACGLRQLEGRQVSGALITALAKLALRVARSAEVAGMPWAAAEALSLSDVLGDPCGRSQCVLGLLMGMMWHARLAAAVLAVQLCPGGTLCSTGGTAGCTNASSSSGKCNGEIDVVQWQHVVMDYMPLLQKLGLQADAAAAAVVLARHAMAQHPITVLTVAAPGAKWCCLPKQSSSAAAAGISSNSEAAAVAAAAMTAALPNMPAAALTTATGPDAMLAICLSRTSSLAGVGSPRGSMSGSISRAASLVHTTPTPGAGSSSNTSYKGREERPPCHGGGKRSSAGAGSDSGSKQQQQLCILGLSWELARQSGDKIRAVAQCVGAQYSCLVLPGPAAAPAPGTSSSSSIPHHHPQQQQQGLHPPGMHQPGITGRARPLVFACRQSGIISGELCAPANLLTHLQATMTLSPHRRRQQQSAPTAARSSTGGGISPSLNPSLGCSGAGGLASSPGGLASSGGSLSGFMSQMLEQLRWPPDPWVVGEFPNRRSHSFNSAGMGHVHAAALAAHPSRPLYVSGSSTGCIYLWQFGEQLCKAAYVPVTAAQLQASPKRMAVHEAVTTPHWGTPTALRFSRSGGRFGAVGEGGLVGLWRQDFISAVDGLGHAEWVGHCLSRSGTGITFLGDTGSQVLVSGVGDKGGAVVLVDTLAPPANACAAQLLSPRGVTPTTVTLVPGCTSSSGAGPGAVLVVGDDAGGLQGFDVRVLSDSRPLWSAKPHHDVGLAAAGAGGVAGEAGVTCVTCWDPGMVGSSSGISAGGSSDGGGGSAAAAAAPSWLSDLVVSGSKNGSLAVVNAHTGSTLQLLQLAHYTERRGLLERVVGSRTSSGSLDDPGPLLRVRPASAVPAAVADVAATAEGLISVGADGVMRFHPLAHVLNEWAGDDYY